MGAPDLQLVGPKPGDTCFQSASEVGRAALQGCVLSLRDPMLPPAIRSVRTELIAWWGWKNIVEGRTGVGQRRLTGVRMEEYKPLNKR